MNKNGVWPAFLRNIKPVFAGFCFGVGDFIWRIAAVIWKTVGVSWVKMADTRV